MTTAMPTKTGRKQRPYKASWGETIDGLYLRHDNRWRIVSTGKVFTEPDERKAVDRFHELSGGYGATVEVLPVHRTLYAGGLGGKQRSAI